MRILIASNREPVRRTENEETEWQPTVGGLTTALLPVLEERGGVWVAWGEEDAERVPRLEYPPEEPALAIRRIALDEQLVRDYYYGFSNRVLWPLCHYFTEQMDIRHEYFEAYREVNQRFADVLAEEYRPGDLVWVQDYHLLLVPALLRRLRPEARIGFFHHIPWPAAELWKALPWANELAEGLLGADLLGFHTQTYCDAFLEAAAQLPDAVVAEGRVSWRGREIKVEPHPIGIDTARFEQLAADEGVQAEAERIRSEVFADLLLLGVDRLDYTKGVPERLLAFERLLQERPEYRGRVTFFQISAPSRTRIESYQELKRSVDEIAGRINGTFTEGEWLPVRYLYRSHDQAELTALYLAADVMVVTPFRDGMNVVAQEFSLTTRRGVLVLSDLTGAAEVLSAPIQVNPYDLEGLTEALRRALELGPEERRELMAPVREQVKRLDAHQWAGRFLASLEAE